MKRLLIILCVVALLVGGAFGFIGAYKYYQPDLTEVNDAHYKILEAKYNKQQILYKLWMEQWQEYYRGIIVQKNAQITALVGELAQTQKQKWGSDSLADFDSLEELLGFLSTQKLWHLPYESGEWVCSHYSFQLMKNAASQGYRIYPVLIYSMYGNSVHSQHMSTFALVNEQVPEIGVHQAIYLIDPTWKEIHRMGLLYDEDTWRDTWYPLLNKLIRSER